MANRILSLEDIREAEAASKTRGEYWPVIQTFAKSGELAMDFSERFPSKGAASLRNSVTQNIDKHREDLDGVELKSMFQVDGDDKHVLVVNMNVYRAQADAARNNGNGNVEQ